MNGIGECVRWTGPFRADGYGQKVWRENGKFKAISAHRWTWEKEHGPIPKGLHVLHLCDNKWCVNPAHLQADTPQENARQYMERLYTPTAKPRGERSGMSKLKEQQVREIRQLLASRMTQVDIAKIYGVTQSAIRAIRIGKTWSWLSDTAKESE